MKEQIEELINKRNVALEVDDDVLVDRYAEQIFAGLKESQDTLPVEFIIESLTKLGHPPSILYDDNGHFTIGADGSQNLPTIGDEHKTKETCFEGFWTVKPGGWKKTIREAVRAYLDER
jgi:hypothetical protein